jgi:FkbM family methyltransferase
MLTKVKSIIKTRISGAAEAIVYVLVKGFRLDTRKIFFEINGILKYRDHESGEKWLINRVLPQILSDIDEPIILDIGANIGDYSIALASALPSCRCYALEPNPITFKRLSLNTSNKANILPLNYAAGSEKQHIKLFVYKTDSSTSHASLYKEVFKECHMQNDSNIEAVSCTVEKVDDLIGSGIIPEPVIHFIKIDTEGHEYEGLKGALYAIRDRGVRAIQFEFNEMNVFSRVFLKDFYDLLGDEWCFFRLDSHKLIPLGSHYDTANEIFKFQNIIAIRESFLPVGLCFRRAR